MCQTRLVNTDVSNVGRFVMQFGSQRCEDPVFELYRIARPVQRSAIYGHDASGAWRCCCSTDSDGPGREALHGGAPPGGYGPDPPAWAGGRTRDTHAERS